MQITGQCLCGAVAFTGTPRPHNGISVCHCGQCRRWASGPLMSIRMADGVTLTRDDGLVWYAASDHGERGFCRHCGATLFWRVQGVERDWSASVGTLVGDHGQQIVEHIWSDDKPDFYDFTDDAPRKTAAECLARKG
jgi:hypothetical protein